MKILISLVALALGASPSLAAAPAAAERLYALNCGTLSAPDKSIWTPGKNVGVAATLSENCFLIKHKDGYLLWDTGIADSLAGKPLTTHGMTLARAQTLLSEFAVIGVKPEDVRYVAVSHTHPDHTGNLGEFPGATLLVQQKEIDWSAQAGFLKLRADRKVEPLQGDRDVFGDGSVTILATPGHTPGHQSLLVHLKQSGWIVLGGDVAHLLENYQGDVVPKMNIEPDASHQSMARIKEIAASKKAKVWINHDPDQSSTLKRPPAFYK